MKYLIFSVCGNSILLIYMAFSIIFSNLLYSTCSAKPHNLISKQGNCSEPSCVPYYKTVSLKVHECTIGGNIITPLKHHQSRYWNGLCNATLPGRVLVDDEEKVDELRQLILSNNDEKDSIESLIFVDGIQRAGVSHHFQGEIDAILRRQYEATTYDHKYNTLHDVSLSFRLLRQHGYDISPDVLKNFNGKFNEEIARDIRGVLELYEASQLVCDGERELDEAATISTRILNQSLANTNNNASTLGFRLNHPYHKSIAGIMQIYFLKHFVGMNERDMALRRLVKHDMETKQMVYQQELLRVFMWWDELGCANKLKLARNQPLKWYTWSMAILIDDISLSSQRVELTKSIAFIYLIDDIFDLYGTPDELKVFVEAVKRWDYAAIDTLPDYMKMCYKALLDTINHVALSIYENHGYNPIESLKATWVNLCSAFFVEANWFASGELPNAREYLENGIISSGVHVVLVHVFFLLGHGEMSLSHIWELVSSVATILRLWDDLGNANDEHQDGKDGSYVEYYMNDHKGVTLEQARQHAVDLIAIAWKRLNRECLHVKYGSPMPFIKASLNLARMVPLMYDYDDNQKLPMLQEYVNFMLLNEATLD